MTAPNPLDFSGLPELVDAHNNYQHFKKLAALGDQMTSLRRRFEPIHEYHFPGWISQIAQKLGLAKRPDWSRYLGELRTLQDESGRIAEQGKHVVEIILATNVDERFKNLAKLCFNQLYYEASVINQMQGLVSKMVAGDPNCMAHFVVMQDMRHKAQQNFPQLMKMANSLRRAV